MLLPLWSVLGLKECFVRATRDEAATFMCGSGYGLGVMLNLA